MNEVRECEIAFNGVILSPDESVQLNEVLYRLKAVNASLHFTSQGLKAHVTDAGGGEHSVLVTPVREMSREEVVSLMESTANEIEWKQATLKVKANHGGDYPAYWFEAIIQSGLCDRVTAAWSDGMGSGFGITTFDREGNAKTRIVGGPRHGEVVDGPTPDGPLL